ncbi:MAG: beta-aspartyl-peptidase, partial [Bacteroidetes bacterium]
MYKIFLPLLLLSACCVACSHPETTTESEAEPTTEPAQAAEYALVIHGGAGTIRRSDLTPAQDSSYRAALNAALDIGEKILAEGGAAIDAVEQTIHYLENSPLFNAGKGAVFTHEGRNEMD